MRIFALSDIHVDYDANLRWVHGLSRADYREDVLILAGDISHRRRLLAECLEALSARFGTLLFVPGNHDLWVAGEPPEKHSLEKFAEVMRTAADCGAISAPVERGDTLLAPLLSWYDYSFAAPDEELMRMWADFRACRWPEGYDAPRIAAHFAAMNPAPPPRRPRRVITYSHFLPRIDLVPALLPRKYRMLDPVLGSEDLDTELRRFSPDIHVYGHSHINRSLRIDGVRYVNNAYGYPQEERIASKRLLCIQED
jgi:predicted phosphodiesterase